MGLKRLGLFGGSFDPVHHGHLILARHAFEQLRLDECWFIPCARSADGKRLSPAAARWRWLKKALQGEPGFKAWDGELKRGGLSRSIDTARQLRALLGPQTRLFWLLGQDQAAQLPRWKEPQALARVLSFGIFSRAAIPRPKLPGFKVRWLKTPLIGVSSTEIRRRIKDKRELTGLLPESIRRDPVLLKKFS